jgi:hypothetical protein
VGGSFVGVWVRSAAIRPVPFWAQLPHEAIAAVEEWLGDDEATTEERLGETFERFEQNQPALARRIGVALTRTQDEVALALGYFLSLVVWLAFDKSHGKRLARVSDTAVDSVDEALDLDEKLRGEDPAEAVDSDDVVAMEQPHLMHFIHEHIDAALDVHAGDVDVDAVHGVYRLMLVEVLALSYAIAAPKGSVGTSSEIHA